MEQLPEDWEAHLEAQPLARRYQILVETAQHIAQQNHLLSLTIQRLLVAINSTTAGLQQALIDAQFEMLTEQLEKGTEQ